VEFVGGNHQKTLFRGTRHPAFADFREVRLLVLFKSTQTI
jgi:hypothetical protein